MFTSTYLDQRNDNDKDRLDRKSIMDCLALWF